MLEAKAWWSQWGARRPWLVLDGGASLARRSEFDLGLYSTLARSGALGSGPADVAFVPDAAAARGVDVQKAQFVLVPRDLAVADVPGLRELDAAGRLVGYDPAETGGQAGAAAAIHLLGAQGARHVRTLGVDPAPFGDSIAEGIGAAIQKFGLYCGPLTAEVPARIYIGSDPSQALGAKVLEYSIRKHSTLTTAFDTMQHVRFPTPRDPRNQARTQFSFSRFAIPSLAGYHGRAVYLDADMLVFSDLRELWELPFGDATVLYAPPSHPSRVKQTSVMLLDCDRLSWDPAAIVREMDEGRYDYDGLLRDLRLEPEEAVQARVPTDWNSLEEYVPGRTRLLHYTDMKTQPWVSRRNPNGALWVQTLREAVESGFITQDEVRQAVRDGFLRPSLAWQLRMDPRKWPGFLRTAAPLLDLRYRPHRGLRKRLKRARIGVS